MFFYALILAGPRIGVKKARVLTTPRGQADVFESEKYI